MLVKQNKIYAIDSLLLHYTFLNVGITFDSYYWRTQDGAEVDLIIEYGGEAIPFEITSSTCLSKRDATGLMSFLSDNPRIKRGYIVIPGREMIEISPNIIAVPDWWILGCY